MIMITVTLDAGHYAKYNHSPVTKGYYESERMWLLSKKLGEALTVLGCRVAYTRKDQTKDLEVYKRGKLSKGTDLFISLHSDGASSEDVSRVSVFAAFDNKNNAKVPAKMLADTVADTMGIKKRAVKTRVNSKGNNEYYGVMRGARNVGCPLYYIIEHGFHTNRHDSLWLMDDANLDMLAKAEAKTIMLYFSAQNAFDGLLYGFCAGIDIKDAVSTLKALGYDASAQKASGNIATGDVVYINGAAFKAIVMGDANGDGRINILDYTIARRIRLGMLKPDEYAVAALDFDGDGTVGDADVETIKNHIRRR